MGHQFDPAVDVERDSNGLWRWSDKPETHRAVQTYFETRNGDGATRSHRRGIPECRQERSNAA
ncbi:hypothetical protein LzC2_22900 [Planctomycetes bacterium LzC2]|uniref:Uncharacterized protein n=1 Tax=Alienimonas chondri TaxID=2681879 RepID=A0ABX1VEQ5_9PLAN|nr:hypothetical protein [Alienimonas chondri]